MPLGEIDADQHQYDRWLRRVRRAEGIPDLVGDVEAWRVMVHRLVESTDVPDVSDKSGVFEGILEALLDQLVDGSFDFLLLDAEQSFAGTQIRRESLIRELIRSAPGSPPGGRGYPEEIEAALEAVAIEHVSLIVSHVRRWPFETQDHLYFSLE